MEGISTVISKPTFNFQTFSLQTASPMLYAKWPKGLPSYSFKNETAKKRDFFQFSVLSILILKVSRSKWTTAVQLLHQGNALYILALRRKKK